MPPLRALFYGSAPYHLALWSPPPSAPVLHLRTPWPGSRERGAALLGGVFAFGGVSAESAMPPWEADRPESWRAALHGFAWLADLAAFDSEAAVKRAREWTADWVRRFDVYDSLAWRADVTGNRLFAWIEHYDLLNAGAGSSRDGDALTASIARQARHLAHVAGREGAGLRRLAALRGLLAAAAALGRRRALAQALKRLARALDEQVLGDGGHRGHGPSAQAEALRYMIDARTALVAADETVPAFLAAAIDRAGPMLRFFRHGDGRMALFNGAGEGDPAQIDRILAHAGSKGRAPLSAPESGFERLLAGGTLVVFDCGGPAPPGYDDDAHAGMLAFEMSHARERIIVNCGDYRGPSAEWRTAMRATAAHSTVVVSDTNAVEIGADGTIGDRPTSVPHQRAEDGGNLWVAATHDGYRRFGLTHARRLFLAADGDDLRGEDSLTGAAGRGFAIRFHLHPRAMAMFHPEGNAALIRLAGGSQWRLRAEGAVLSLAESVYMGEGAPQKTQQIVLDGHVGSGGATVRWAIRRE
ncbi:MAG TPA: heparinase II/III family protein [Stellaceae bacterium]|nr:heparinase II/III family protein [Stellaceae bacterium]